MSNKTVHSVSKSDDDNCYDVQSIEYSGRITEAEFSESESDSEFTAMQQRNSQDLKTQVQQRQHIDSSHKRYGTYDYDDTSSEEENKSSALTVNSFTQIETDAMDFDDSNELSTSVYSIPLDNSSSWTSEKSVSAMKEIIQTSNKQIPIDSNKEMEKKIMNALHNEQQKNAIVDHERTRDTGDKNGSIIVSEAKHSKNITQNDSTTTLSICSVASIDMVENHGDLEFSRAEAAVAFAQDQAKKAEMEISNLLLAQLDNASRQKLLSSLRIQEDAENNDNQRECTYQHLVINLSKVSLLDDNEKKVDYFNSSQRYDECRVSITNVEMANSVATPKPKKTSKERLHLKCETPLKKDLVAEEVKEDVKEVAKEMVKEVVKEKVKHEKHALSIEKFKQKIGMLTKKRQPEVMNAISTATFVNENKSNGEKCSKSSIHSSFAIGSPSTQSGQAKPKCKTFEECARLAKSSNRKSFSFSNERVREIERHNLILLKKITAQKPNFSKTNGAPITVINSRETHAAVNRRKQQRQIDLDNIGLRRRLQAISVRRKML